MKITIALDEGVAETEIAIRCGRISEDIEKLMAAVSVLDMKLVGTKDGQKHILEASKIRYIDTVDKRTFLYADDGVFETVLKLYELEDRLSSCGFLRAGKSCLFNFNYIKSFKSDLDGRIIVSMDKGFKVVVSRQYVAALKKKLEGLA